MSVIRVGSSSKYATGWDAVFGRSKSSRTVGTSAAKKAAGRKAAPKKAGLKKATKAALKKVAGKPRTKVKRPGKSRRG